MSFIDGIFRLLNHVVDLPAGMLRCRSILNGGSCSMILEIVVSIWGKI